jgi:AraC-like DNA-binding protein
MDLLGDIFSVLKVHASLYFRATLRKPFAIRVPADGQRVRFHVAGVGRTWLGIAGGDGVTLEPGDLALVPHGSAHILADAPDTPALPLRDVLSRATPERVGHLTYGGRGARSVLVCGHFAFLDSPAHPVLVSLPRLIHIPARFGLDYRWFELVLRHMAEESRIGLPGHEAVLSRLSEVLLMQALRAHVENDRLSAPGLRALTDPSLRRALTALHADPAAKWTVGSLARTAYLSRTGFAGRFREHFGMPPMHYLTLWRLQKARVLLLDGGLQVKEVVRAVGFASESAFSRAFKAQFGSAPGAQRGKRRTGARGR